MKINLYVFSGTGNTRLVAELYKKNFETLGAQVNIHDIRMEKSEGKFKYTEFPDPQDADLIGLGYPVHGFNAPKVMNDFCKLFPQVQNKNTFIFKSSGEGLPVNNYSSQKIIRLLEKKGFCFLTERHVVMPYNMIFRHSDDMVKSEYKYAQKLAELNAKEVLNGKKEKVKFCPLKYLYVPIVRIEWIYAKLQGPFMKVNSKKCISCMKCVRNCPLQNISFDKEKNKFNFGTNCALCVCCSFGCPTKAISIGLLNGWRINGSYKITEKAEDNTLDGEYFGEKLKGLHRWLYYRYFRKLDKMFIEAGLE